MAPVRALSSLLVQRECSSCGRHYCCAANLSGVAALRAIPDRTCQWRSNCVMSYRVASECLVTVLHGQFLAGMDLCC